MAFRQVKRSKVDQIIEAALAGNLRRIKKLVKEIEYGKRLPEFLSKIRDLDGRGLLHVAALNGRTSICKYLIEEFDLDIDEKDSEDCTPLLHASLGGNLSTVTYLVENGADPDALNKYDTTALHVVTLEGNIEVMHFLLSKGSDVDASSVIGTPLQLAAQLCDPDVLRILLDHGACPNLISLIPSPLDFSISRSLECTKLLIEAGADPNFSSWGMTPLASAARKGDIEIIKCLLEADADPDITNDVGLKPIEIAALKGNSPALEFLYPVTSPILSYTDWSVDGILKHVRSEEFVKQMEIRVGEKRTGAQSKGEDALKKKDYHSAAFYYTEALSSDPSDASALSNRSMCLACVGDGSGAWSDAKACVMLRPDWPEAYYRAGVALLLLEKFGMAADTFLMGLKLDPDDQDLKDAFRRAVEAKMTYSTECPLPVRK